MKLRLILISLLITLTSLNFSCQNTDQDIYEKGIYYYQNRNQGIYEKNGVLVMQNLEFIQWKRAIDADDLEWIGIGLELGDFVQAIAIKTIAVHKAADSKYILDELKNSNKTTPNIKRLSDIILQGLNSNEDFFSFLLKQVNVDELSLEKHLKHIHWQPSLSDILVEIIVIEKCKLLRAGKSPSFMLPETYLTNYQKLLLKYSAFSDATAIDSLIGKISKIQMYDNQACLNLLNSYNLKPFDKVLNIMSNVDSLKSLSANGKTILMSHLVSKSLFLPLSKKEKVKKTFQNPSLRNVLEESESIKILLVYLDEYLEPVFDREKLRKRLEKFENKEMHQRMMDSLRLKFKAEQAKNN